MAARSAWSGTITFAGFPFAVKAYNFGSSTKRQSFKTLCECHGQPIAQKNTCATDGTILAKTVKGIEVSKGVFQPLDDAAVANVTQRPATTSLNPERVCPVSTLGLHMSKAAYAIVPDGDAYVLPVAGLWAVLHKTERALVQRWVPKANSKDQILAVHAGGKGLIANVLPSASELNNPNERDLTGETFPPQQLAMFEQALGALYPNEDYDAIAFDSDFDKARADAVAAVLSGNAPTTVSAAPAAAAVPDLMASLEASLAAVQATPVAA
jgi:DNA end-binding protein Ku